MSFAASTLHPARRRGLDYAKDVWGIADRRLGNGWALGGYSIADIHLFRLYWRFANSLKPAPETFPNLAAHYARMMARPAVQRTIEIESAIGYELPARSASHCEERSDEAIQFSGRFLWIASLRSQ
jgi:glutathione S-transferase